MIKKNFILLFLFLISIISNSYAQIYWKKSGNQNIFQQKQQISKRDNFPSKYTLMTLDYKGFSNNLYKTKNSSSYIYLPNSLGELERFNIIETSTLAPKLAKKFPMIKTYIAYSKKNKLNTARLTTGTNGLHVVLNYPNKTSVYIDPLSNTNNKYIIYKKNDLASPEDSFKCETIESDKNVFENNFSYKTVNNIKLKTYRLALACTGEYANFHLNRQKVPTTASDETKKAAVLSAMNTTIARVNQIYERDLAVRLEIVENNENLIFLDSDTDDLSNDNAGLLIDESQVKCDDIIGNENYDIGHTFSTGGGGYAGLGVVCYSNYKGRGITGSSQPINDPYDIDYVAHEMGHQFGAGHTQNNSCNRSSATSVEPGSGSTIMGYAGICSPNVQKNSDDHFHAVSIAQMQNHIQRTAGCPTEINTGNLAPTANAGNDYSIPKSTPFVLKGNATDGNTDDVLTYNWEQIDTEIGSMPPRPTNTKGPMFRSLPSNISPNRYMPDLNTVISGSTANTWEVVPSVAREMNFALTVRDNHVGGGGSARDDMKITIVDTTPFSVTSHNTNTEVISNNTETITWNKGNTDLAPINCKLVNIKLSTDGGKTFPFILKENTPNDGSEDVIIPDEETSQARIMVEAADNLFYNVNSTNFKIKIGATYKFTDIDKQASICSKAVNEYTFNFTYDTFNGFNDTVNLSTTGNPENSTLTFSNSSLKTKGTYSLTIKNLNEVDNGDYEITIKAQSSINKMFKILLSVNDNGCKSNGNSSSQISITKVEFSSINNSSTKTYGYENYTDLIALVTKEDNYDLTVNTNNDDKAINTYAYIDWNQNCLFEDDEMYNLNDGTLNIVIPEEAKLGNTTLRVITKNSESGVPKSCELNFDGEVEDYTISVEESYATDQNLFSDINLYPVPATNKITINFKVKDKEQTIVSLFDLSGRLLKTEVYNIQSSRFLNDFNLNAFSGVYLLQIKNGGKQITKNIVIK